MKKWLLRPYRHVLDFSGRSPRRELAIFILTHIVVLYSAIIAIDAAGQDASRSNGVVGLVILYVFGAIVLSLPILIRRLHDTDRSAWWLLTWLFPVIGGLFLLVLLCVNGDEDENRFGHNPRLVDLTDAEVFS